MATPLKDSLDYFPLNCNFFEDKSIKGLRVRFGNDGIVVYLYLLCVIYRDNGYYVEFDEDLILDVADSTHISEDYARNIIEHIISRSLFDPHVADAEKALTSKAIQRRFQKGKTRSGNRRKVEVHSEYWLLSEDETEPWIDVLSNEHLDCQYDLSEKSVHNDEQIDDCQCNLSEQSEQKPLKESKVKKSKVKDNKKNYADAVTLTEEEYGKLIKKHTKTFVDKCIEVLNNYKLSSGKTYKSDYYAILNWVIDRVTKDYPKLDAKPVGPPKSDEELFSNPWSDIDG